jgi:RNA polymerase sigma factor (sigma-70 family)
MTSDSELLARFAKTNSEDAFAEIVRRHVNLVYSAAFRQVNGDEHWAKDISQTVFTDLARKANSLSRHKNLTGWLYTSAHFAAAKIVRGENRRRDREEKFMREPIFENAPDASRAEALAEAGWEKIRPALDDAMHELKESDREAILFRYFENFSFGEVGAKLGLNENAARMRVERALEKLRAIFAKRGITTATAFASVISANAMQIAPANLAATLTTTSIATAGTGTFTLLKIMTATKIKLAVSAIVVASAATAFVIQQQTQNKLRVQNESLQQQLAQLQSDDENFSNRLANVDDSKKLSDDQFNELLKLRGEVGVLRAQNDELAKLQNENQKLRRDKSILEVEWNNVTNSSQIMRGPYLNRDSWSDIGTAEPLDALKSLLWALKENKEDRIDELVATNALNLNLILSKGFWDKVKGMHIVLINNSSNGNGQQRAIIDTIVERTEPNSSDVDTQSPAAQDYLTTRQTIRRWFLNQIDGQWQITGME